MGEMNYNISLLLIQNNLEISQQPYDLQMAEVDSKLILSMSLSVWNYIKLFFIHFFINNKYICVFMDLFQM